MKTSYTSITNERQVVVMSYEWLRCRLSPVMIWTVELTTIALMFRAWEGFMWHSCLRASVLRRPPTLSSSWRSPFLIKPLQTRTADKRFSKQGAQTTLKKDISRTFRLSKTVRETLYNRYVFTFYILSKTHHWHPVTKYLFSNNSANTYCDSFICL